MLLNVISKRKIKTTGRVYKKLISDGWIVNGNRIEPPNYNSIDFGKITKVINPETGSTINIRSKIFTTLLKKYDYLKINENDAVLVDKNRDKKEDYLIIKLLNDEIDITVNTIVRNDIDKVINKNSVRNNNKNSVRNIIDKVINKNSKEYKKLIDSGYRLDKTKKKLYFPLRYKVHNLYDWIWEIKDQSGSNKTEFDKKTRKNVEYMNMILMSLNPFTSGDVNYIPEWENIKSVHIMGEGRFSSVDTTTKGKFRKSLWGFLNAIKYNYENTNYNAFKIYIIYKTSKNKPVVRIGNAYDINCVYKSIVKKTKLSSHIKLKLYEITKNGTAMKDYKEIATLIKRSIEIYTDLSSEPTFEYKHGSTHPIKLMYRNNHMDIYNKKEISSKIIARDFLDINNYNPREITNIIGDINYPLAITTKDYTYKLTKHKEINLDDDIFSGISQELMEICRANPKIKPIRRTHDNYEAIKSILHHGICYQSPDYISSNAKCVDLISAYMSYEKNNFYSGFPTDLDICIKINKQSLNKNKQSLNINDIIEVHDIIHNYEGFARVIMSNLLNDEIVDVWISFPFLRHRIENLPGSIKEINCLMISTGRENLYIPDKIDKFSFYRTIGKMSCTRGIKSFCTTDTIFAESIPVEEGWYLSPSTKYKNLIRVCKKIEKTSDKTFLPHIASYIYQYTDIEVEQLILENRRLNVCRVWVDGVTFDEKTPFSLKYDKSKWREKEALSGWCNVVKNNYKKAVECIKFSNKFNILLQTNKLFDNINIIKGAAGTGKSYNLREIYNQTCNSIILVPTHELKKRFRETKIETIDKYIIQRGSKIYDNIFIDEYGMIGRKKFAKLKEFMSKKRVYLFGDVCQLRPVNDKPINEKNIKNIELTRNYRHRTDGTFLGIISKIRNALKKGELLKINSIKKHFPTIGIDEALKKKCLILTSTNKNLDQINSRGFKLNKNPIKCGYKEDLPVRYMKTRTKYNTSQCATLMIIHSEKKFEMHNDDEKVITIDKETCDRDVKQAYAITYHGIQGKTIRKPNTLVIDIRKLFDPNMLYTGLTRVENADQVYILDC